MTFWGGESGHWKAWNSDIRNPWNNCLKIPYAEAPPKKSSIWKQTSVLSWLKIGSVTSHIRRLVARHWESFGRIRFLRDSSTRRRLQLLPKSQSLSQELRIQKTATERGTRFGSIRAWEIHAQQEDLNDSQAEVFKNPIILRERKHRPSATFRQPKRHWSSAE